MSGAEGREGSVFPREFVRVGGKSFEKNHIISLDSLAVAHGHDDTFVLLSVVVTGAKSFVRKVFFFAGRGEGSTPAVGWKGSVAGESRLGVSTKSIQVCTCS